MHRQVPDKATEQQDQQKFDEAVNRKGKVVLQTLGGVGVVGALLMSAIALNNSSEKSETGSSAKAGVTQVAAVAAAPAPAAAAQVVSTTISGSSKVGPDGKKHDAFTTTEFAVKVGQPLTLKIDNTDDVPHSISAPAAGVNIVAQPGTHTYSLVVKQAGKFQWYCMVPCDTDTNGWAMQHPGFMSGYITAS
jgi:plastocyanin